jgi:hypothetical protein
MTYRRLFENSLLFTVIFPNLKVISSSHSFQPLTLPLIAVDVVLRARTDRFAAFFLVVYAACVLASLLIHANVSAPSLLYSALYLSGPLTFFYFLGRTEPLSKLLINVGLAFTFLTVAEQLYVRSPLVESLIAHVFANRPEEVVIGLRGAGGFMSEPSQSGRLYFFLLFLAYAVDLRQRNLWLALSVPFLLMNRSASAFLIFVVLLAALSYRKSRTLTAILIAVAAAGFPYFLMLEFRFVDIFERLLLLWNSRGDESLVATLGLAGGRRLIQTTIGYASLGSFPLGNGLGSSLESFRDVAHTMGFALTEWGKYASAGDELKPSSYVSQIIYDFGWLGLPMIAALAAPLWLFRVSPDPVHKALFYLGVAQLLLASPTTIPWPWVMMALGLVRKPLEPAQCGEAEAGPEGTGHQSTR